MQLLAVKFAQIDAKIDAKNAQIIALQTEVTELQEHRQQLLSVEQAVQSVLAQTDTALMMLSHVDPTQIEIFRDALVAKFNLSAIGLIESAIATEPEPATEPVEPDAPTGDEPKPATEPAIDVQVMTAPEPTPAPQPEPASEPDIEQALTKMPLVSLRMLAKSKGMDARGTKANIAARLKAIVTNVDIRALA